MDTRRSALAQERLIGELHAGASSQHRIDKHQSLTLDRGGGEIFHEDVKTVALLLIAAIGADEGILGLVKIVEKSMVEWEPGSKDSGEHHMVCHLLTDAFSQGGLNLDIPVIETLGDLISHNLADAVKIGAEAERILLYVDLAELHHVSAHQRGTVCKINYLYHFYL